VCAADEPQVSLVGILPRFVGDKHLRYAVDIPIPKVRVVEIDWNHLVDEWLEMAALDRARAMPVAQSPLCGGASVTVQQYPSLRKYAT